MNANKQSCMHVSFHNHRKPNLKVGSACSHTLYMKLHNKVGELRLQGRDVHVHTTRTERNVSTGQKRETFPLSEPVSPAEPPARLAVSDALNVGVDAVRLVVGAELEAVGAQSAQARPAGVCQGVARVPRELAQMQLVLVLQGQRVDTERLHTYRRGDIYIYTHIDVNSGGGGKKTDAAGLTTAPSSSSLPSCGRQALAALNRLCPTTNTFKSGDV